MWAAGGVGARAGVRGHDEVMVRLRWEEVSERRYKVPGSWDAAWLLHMDVGAVGKSLDLG